MHGGPLEVLLWHCFHLLVVHILLLLLLVVTKLDLVTIGIVHAHIHLHLLLLLLLVVILRGYGLSEQLVVVRGHACVPILSQYHVGTARESFVILVQHVVSI